jgi:serine/threonine protein kinase
MRGFKDRKLIGAGQFGHVYRAIDVDSGKFVAVKVLRPPTAKQGQGEKGVEVYNSLKREIEILSKLNRGRYPPKIYLSLYTSSDTSPIFWTT